MFVDFYHGGCSTVRVRSSARSGSRRLRQSRSRRGDRRRVCGFVADDVIERPALPGHCRRRTASSGRGRPRGLVEQRCQRARCGRRRFTRHRGLQQAGTDAHMRISDDYGATFGPRIIVSAFCRDCPEGGSQPMGIDARGGDILVEVLQRRRGATGLQRTWVPHPQRRRELGRDASQPRPEVRRSPGRYARRSLGRQSCARLSLSVATPGHHVPRAQHLAQTERSRRPSVRDE